MTRESRAQERVHRQRERILDAAQQCFVQRGFHAASMASIAETAKMSAGLIYRYFDSKSAIILAIIERQLADKRASIATLQSAQDLDERIRDLFARWRSADPTVMNPALFLEISAEASRDPQIAAAVSRADRLSGTDLCVWLERALRAGGAEPGDSEIRARILLLQCFVEGLAIRAVRDPGFDAAILAAALGLLLPAVLAPARPAPSE